MLEPAFMPVKNGRTATSANIPLGYEERVMPPNHAPRQNRGVAGDSSRRAIRSPGQWLLAPAKGRFAFTVIELLVVVGIMGVLIGLVTPAIIGLKGASNATKAAYDVAGAVENARAYAMANNTYVWVGFFEEDASKAPGIAGIGRIVISVVASTDGTGVFSTGVTAVDSARLIQVNAPMTIENVHLKTASSGDADFPVGTGNGDSFDTRPAVNVTGGLAQIGDTTPPSSITPFPFPTGSASPQYTFTKVIQFNPRGEAAVTSVKAPATAFQSRPIVEIGLQSTHGSTPDPKNRNVAAIQISGLVGNVKIYRRQL